MSVDLPVCQMSICPSVYLSVTRQYSVRRGQTCVFFYVIFIVRHHIDAR